jgi:single-strand DNA-binding protein
VNKVILVGFLGDAPELKFSQQGKPVCTFSLAVNERWKDAEGSPRERVEWFKIVCFGRLAEFFTDPAVGLRTPGVHLL